MTYLTSRPYTEVEDGLPQDARERDATGRCVLGRETAIAAVSWTDGWPRIEGAAPALEVPAPSGPVFAAPEAPARDDFDEPALDPRWSTLRRHADPSWLSLAARPSHLRVAGGQSPHGKRTPSLVAQRVTAKHGVFEAGLEFDPRTADQTAGITAYYNGFNWHCLQVGLDQGRRMLSLVTCDRGRRTATPVAALGTRLDLRIAFDGPTLRFAYRENGPWQDLAVTADTTILSDEHATWIEPGLVHAFGFTGAFVGLWVQDLAAEGGFADFDYAEYRPASASRP
jgi:xylan 1,4-beta-xylosidase